MKRAIQSLAPERVESEPKHNDLVFVRELFVKAMTGVDAWHRPQPQPVSISIWLQTSVAQAGSTDHLVYSLNYDVISRKVTRMVETTKFKSLEEIAENVAAEVLKESVGGQWAKIHVKKPRALLRAGAAEIIISRKKKITGKDKYEIVLADGTTDVVRIQKLQLTTIIGVNTIERMHKQNVVIDLTLYRPEDETDGFNKHYDFRACVDVLESHVEDSTYKTVEAFVTSVAEVVCRFGVRKVTVRAEKPSAITFADAAGVEITRDREFFQKTLQSALNSGATTPQLPRSSGPLFPQSGLEIPGNGNHTVFIAFGSNVGDPVSNIRTAIDELNKRNIKVVNTSTLYESAPMYVVDQPNFVNGVLKAETVMKPLELLDALQDIEKNELKRVKLVEKGPRSIDLDILLYDDLVMNDSRLDIPHVGMLARSFVLQPLTELVASSDTHPLTAESYHQHLEELFRQESDPTVQASSHLKSLIPISSKRSLVLDPTHRSVPTQIMAILNITPDSFSDGGKTTLENVVQKATEFVAQGANILDVGGMSTAPSKEDPPTEEEELNRVIPAIKALRQCSELDHISISIDTYRSNVARQAIEAGADIINDISAAQMDPAILKVAKDLNAPIILNHTRGNAKTMNTLANYTSDTHDTNSPKALIESVANELEQSIDQAVAHGIPRWQIILDPGIGFAKNKDHNVALIRHFNDLVRAKDSFIGLPWLVGPSRKRFIGTITGAEIADKRVYGTAAAVTALVAGGADIVRVHDVAEMRQVVKMADAIYRPV